jgi:hypothetical protein
MKRENSWIKVTEVACFPFEAENFEVEKNQNALGSGRKANKQPLKLGT